MVTANYTPRVSDVTPEYGMPGQLVELHGTNLAAGHEVTDTNWYLSEFGFYYQPYTASVTVGSTECKVWTNKQTKCPKIGTHSLLFGTQTTKINHFGSQSIN